ncbi:RagB/SusD family nutrient uptake outer membrane protein [Olivibacter sp. SDN3]|uniref:RagB/SusD family nutrient uptake outer membrane protein n=1 Tax=Olivibacter sp. SDN3 TaxID=2764720 RepID=UPI001651A69D|nr:RagB/SusD family nutrient uptake outer membrane protein [Olivibacter sp. SDN3]QNL50597.1 RagB/SusD family nutrient uptake outer membrane protein [Olivibacter sp. SDN3]
MIHKININKLLLLVVITVVINACSVDKSPYDSIKGDDLNSSETGLEAATLGNYHRMKTWVTEWHILHEFPGDNMSVSGTTSDPLFFSYNYQRVPNSSRTTTYWTKSYEIIVGANKVIEAITEGESPVNDQFLAENYYLRALMHFQLVDIFGRPYNQGPDNLGVPLKLDADQNNHPLRSSVGEVYDQVEADLQKAITLFTAEKDNTFASKEACWALLSRLYLYREQYQQVIEYTDMVINSGKFALLATDRLAAYPTFKPEDNDETIFAVKLIPNVDYPDNGWYTVGSFYANFLGSGWGEMYASRSYLELIREYPEDVRNDFIEPVVLNEDVNWAIYVDNSSIYQWKEVVQDGDDYSYTENGQQITLTKEADGHGGYHYFIETAEGSKRVLIDRELDVRNGFPKYYVLKCSGQEGQAHLWSPVVSRLAEMYLNRAEAHANLGNNGQALADINLIRERAGIPAEGLYSESNLQGKTVLEAVLDERRLELAYEGHRKMDVFRNDQTMDRSYPGAHLLGNNPITEVAPDNRAIIEFIPEAQLLLQEGLEQNP